MSASMRYGFTDYPKVDVLNSWYTSVEFGAERTCWRHRGWAAISASVRYVFTGYPEVDVLNVRYTSVNFGAERTCWRHRG